VAGSKDCFGGSHGGVYLHMCWCATAVHAVPKEMKRKKKKLEKIRWKYGPASAEYQVARAEYQAANAESQQVAAQKIQVEVLTSV